MSPATGRSSPLLVALTAAALLAALAAGATAAGPEAGPAQAAEAAADSLAWRHDPAPDVATAAGAGPALLYFTADWCGPCRLVEREVFAHPEGRGELARFRRFHVDLDHPHGRALADSFRISTVPTFVLLDERGREIDRVRGYRSRRRLLADLSRFRQGEGTLGALQRQVRDHPDDARLQAALGLRLYERLDLGPARRRLSAGLEGALPDTLAAAAARALADLYHRQGDPARATAVLTRLQQGWPDHPYPRATWRRLAALHRDAGQAVAELSALESAAAVPPPRADDLVAFAATAATAGQRLDAAEAAAREAVALTGRADPTALAALAHVLRAQRSYAEALVWIKRAVAAAPDAEQDRWRRERETIWQAALSGN